MRRKEGLGGDRAAENKFFWLCALFCALIIGGLIVQTVPHDTAPSGPEVNRAEKADKQVKETEK